MINSSFEQQLVATVPYRWIGTFENTMDHVQKMIWIKAADRVEPEITADLWPLSQVPIHQDPGRVVVHRSSEAAG